MIDPHTQRRLKSKIYSQMLQKICTQGLGLIWCPTTIFPPSSSSSKEPKGLRDSDGCVLISSQPRDLHPREQKKNDLSEEEYMSSLWEASHVHQKKCDAGVEGVAFFSKRQPSFWSVTSPRSGRLQRFLALARRFDSNPTVLRKSWFEWIKCQPKEIEQVLCWHIPLWRGRSEWQGRTSARNTGPCFFGILSLLEDICTHPLPHSKCARYLFITFHLSDLPGRPERKHDQVG